jgi:hypothetical protein
MRFSWRKEPAEKGLAGVCQGIRYPELFLDGKRVAKIGNVNNAFYWYGGINKNYNTLWDKIMFKTLEECKNHCKNTLKEELN